MADPLGNFVPEFIEKEVERESIVKLARLVTDRIPQTVSYTHLRAHETIG